MKNVIIGRCYAAKRQLIRQLAAGRVLSQMKNASFRDLNESSLLVWPHDHSNNHYATVAADFSDCTIVFANGLGKESALDKDGLLAMGLFLLSLEAQARSFNSGRRFEWKAYVERTRRQADGKSCGPEVFDRGSLLSTDVNCPFLSTKSNSALELVCIRMTIPWFGVFK